MATCALFIDYENVLKSLRGQNIHVSHKALAEIFKSEAYRYGEVVHARAYAPWDIFPEAMSIFDRQDIKPEYVEGGRKDNADLVMSLGIQEFLRIPGRDADTFILVTGDGDFVHVIRILQQEQKRVIIWGVEGSISARLVNRVTEVGSVQELLARHEVLPAERPSAVPGKAVQRTDGPPPREMAVRALILRAESVMLSRGWVQVPFLTLMHEMSISTLFGEDSEQRRMLIVRCLEAGIFETKKQPNPKRPGTDTTFVLLKKDHEVVSSTLQSAGRVILHMRSLLESVPGATWVAYSVLERKLAQDEQLPASEAERRNLIDLCIAEGMLRLEHRENSRPSGSTTPVLYLVEDHPLVEQVVPGEDLSSMVRRLVLAVDHYLIRTGYAWMSMGLLRQQLAACGQREMERAIRVASEGGIIIIRQQPNQFGSRPTTGAYLRRDHPVCQEILHERDALLGALHQAFEGRDLIPVPELQEFLVAERVIKGDRSEVEDWLRLMVSHQILTVSTSSAYGNGNPVYILHKQHPVLVKRVRVAAN